MGTGNLEQHLADLGIDLYPGEIGRISFDDTLGRLRAASDKAGKKSVSYRLARDGNFIYGWIRPHKDGQTHVVVLKDGDKPLAQADRQAIDAKKRALRKQRERQQGSAAEKAEALLARSEAATEAHPYLARKKVPALGVFQRFDSLIIPLYDEQGCVSSVQFIAPDGDKRFLSGGRKQGRFFRIGDDLVNPRVYLVEGYSTGASVHLATGCVVYVCFDAGNMVAVAGLDMLKDKDVVIAADNDEAGLQAATAAAAKTAGRIVAPEEAGKDWNDIHTEKGIGAVQQALMEAPRKDVSAGPALAEAEHDAGGDLWKTKLLRNRNGIDRTSLHNTRLLVENADDIRGVFRYNEFEKKIYLMKEPPWGYGAFQASPLDDVQITECMAYLETLGLSPTRERAFAAIDAAARRWPFNPAQDYFKSLEWDGEPRLATWLVRYLGACTKADEEEYLSLTGTKWLVAAVKRVFEPGCKFDHVLVMEGEQGVGKSYALKTLATFGEDEEEAFFTDSVSVADIQNKDTIQKVSRSIIVELAELAGFSKKDDDEIKRWVTIQEDEIRLPYGRTTTRFPRQFVLAATTNNLEYLKDATGNRRYWPMTVTGRVDIEGLRLVRQQLWAEAYHLYQSGYKIWVSEEEAPLMKRAQEKRLVSDIWDDVVANIVSDRNVVTVTEVVRDLGIDVARRDYRVERRVANILKRFGFERTVTRAPDGTSVRTWQRKGKDEVLWL